MVDTVSKRHGWNKHEDGDAWEHDRFTSGTGKIVALRNGNGSERPKLAAFLSNPEIILRIWAGSRELNALLDKLRAELPSPAEFGPVAAPLWMYPSTGLPILSFHLPPGGLERGAIIQLAGGTPLGPHFSIDILFGLGARQDWNPFFPAGFSIQRCFAPSAATNRHRCRAQPVVVTVRSRCRVRVGP